MGITIFESFICEVYRRIYVRKLYFSAPLTRRRKTKIFRQYIRRYSSQNENCEYSYPLIQYHIFL